MPRPHELLQIEIGQLATADNDLIQSLIQRKYREQLQAIQNQFEDDILTAREFANKKSALDSAFSELDTPEKRTNYLENSSCDAVMTVSDRNAYHLNIPIQKIKDTEKEYSSLVEKTYRNHPNKQTFKTQYCNFNDFNAFKKSDIYKKSFSEQRQNYSENHFPKRCLVLAFDNAEDAIKYIQNLENKKIVPKGETQKAREQLRAEDLSASPTYSTSNSAR